MFGFNPQKQLPLEYNYNAFYSRWTCIMWERRQPKMNPQKYLHMEIMFIQQDYQWPATEKKRCLWGYINKIYKDLATVTMQIYVHQRPIIVHRCAPVVTKKISNKSYGSVWTCKESIPAYLNCVCWFVGDIPPQHIRTTLPLQSKRWG